LARMRSIRARVAEPRPPAQLARPSMHKGTGKQVMGPYMIYDIGNWPNPLR